MRLPPRRDFIAECIAILERGAKERERAAYAKGGHASARARAHKRLRPAPNVVDLAVWRKLNH